MKAYNTPNDELRIENDNGEVLVAITNEKTTVSNLGDDDKAVLTFDIGTPTPSPGWHTGAYVTNDGYLSYDEAQAIFDEWDSCPNPKLKCVAHTAGGAELILTMTQTAQISDGSRLFYGSWGIPNQYAVSAYAVAFTDGVGDERLAIVVSLSYKVEFMSSDQ